MGDTVNADAIDPSEEPGKEAVLKRHEMRTCAACGAKFSATKENEFCPVCMLATLLLTGLNRASVLQRIQSKRTQQERAQRFEHNTQALNSLQDSRLISAPISIL